MWRPHKNSIAVDINVPIRIDRVLYEFDGPMIFTAKLGMYQVIFSRIDEDDDHELYAVGTVNDEIVEAIASGKISVLGGLLSEPCFIIELDGLIVQRCWAFDASEMPMDLLPEYGQSILPRAQSVPDTIEQLNAYFSIRFSGDGLSQDSMLFSTFKNLVDNVYDSTRKLIAPPELQNTKRATFDFRLREPAFGSLILTIESPSVKLSNARRHFKNLEMAALEMGQSFNKSREDFFTELDEVMIETQDQAHFRSSAEKHVELLKNLQELIPHENSHFTQVEFHASLDKGQRSITVDEVAGERLKRAYMSVIGKPKTVRGNITIINSKRRTFVLEANGKREVTCGMNEEIFRTLEESELFRGGSKIEVSGNFYKRSRRDYIAVDGLPILLDENWKPHLGELFK